MNNENIENTASTAGDNVQQINYDELAAKMSEIIERKNAKNENSILRDNFSKLSDEERELAYNAFHDLKTKEANKTANKIADLEKKNAELLNEITTYKTKERQSNFRNNAVNILNEIGITEKTKIDMITDLAANQLYECVDDNNEFDAEKTKTLFNDILKKYEIDLTKKNDTQIQVGVQKQEKQEQNSKIDEYRKILGIIK